MSLQVQSDVPLGKAPEGDALGLRTAIGHGEALAPLQRLQRGLPLQVLVGQAQ